jgi:hypothetical protein
VKNAGMSRLLTQDACGFGTMSVKTTAAPIHFMSQLAVGAANHSATITATIRNA